MQMQIQIEENLKTHGIEFEREVQIEGCQMRADFVGRNWAIETKKSCTSQNMLTAMAQCQVYRQHIGKPFVCTMLPDDIDPGLFYVALLLQFGIPIIKMSQLVQWVKSVENNAQSN